GHLNKPGDCIAAEFLTRKHLAIPTRHNNGHARPNLSDQLSGSNSAGRHSNSYPAATTRGDARIFNKLEAHCSIRNVSVFDEFSIKIRYLGRGASQQFTRFFWSPPVMAR